MAGNESSPDPAVGTSSCNTGVRRRFWAVVLPVALGLGLVTGCMAATIAWLVIPVNYTATAWLHVATSKPKVMFGVGASHSESIPNYRNTQKALLTSNFVLNAALRKPGISQLPAVRNEIDPVTWLRQNTRVRVLDNSEIIEIAIKGDDPVQLVKLVNAVKDAYMEEVVCIQRESGLRRKRVLEHGHHQNQQEIKRKSKALEDLKKELRVVDSEAAGVGQIDASESLADVRDRVKKTRDEIRLVERKITVAKIRLAKAGEKGTVRKDRLAEHEQAQVRRLVDIMMAGDTFIAQTTEQVTALETMIVEENRRAAGPDPPSVTKYREQVESLNKAIARRRSELLPQLTASARQEVARGVRTPAAGPREDLHALIDQLEIEKGVLEKELEVTMVEFGALAKETRRRNGQAAELEAKRNELQQIKQVTQQMRERLEKWEVELAAAPRVTLLEAATVPRSCDIGQKCRRVALAGMIAMAVTFVGVLLLVLIWRTVTTRKS